MLLRSRRAISGESISSLQVFPKVRRTSGEKVEDYFGDDDGCEYSPPPAGCLQCPLPVCKYDAKKWGFQNLGNFEAKSRASVAAN